MEIYFQTWHWPCSAPPSKGGTSPMRTTPLILMIALLAACGGEEDQERRRIAAYDALDGCFVNQDEESCLANADRCVWYDLGMPCAEGEPCVSGVCQDIDPCRAHTDAESCAADGANRCAWAD